LEAGTVKHKKASPPRCKNCNHAKVVHNHEYGCAACPSGNICRNYEPQEVVVATEKKFDNSSKPAAYNQLAAYFQGPKSKKLAEAVDVAIASIKPLTVKELYDASGSHRYGGLLHEIKKRAEEHGINIDWKITEVDGVMYYTFYRSTPLVQNDLWDKEAHGNVEHRDE
jgi:hypothetical protein